MVLPRRMRRSLQRLSVGPVNDCVNEAIVAAQCSSEDPSAISKVSLNARNIFKEHQCSDTVVVKQETVHTTRLPTKFPVNHEHYEHLLDDALAEKVFLIMQIEQLTDEMQSLKEELVHKESVLKDVSEKNTILKEKVTNLEHEQINTSDLLSKHQFSRTENETFVKSLTDELDATRLSLNAERIHSSNVMEKFVALSSRLAQSETERQNNLRLLETLSNQANDLSRQLFAEKQKSEKLMQQLNSQMNQPHKNGYHNGAVPHSDRLIADFIRDLRRVLSFRSHHDAAGLSKDNQLNETASTRNNKRLNSDSSTDATSKAKRRAADPPVVSTATDSASQFIADVLILDSPPRLSSRKTVFVAKPGARVDHIVPPQRASLCLRPQSKPQFKRRSKQLDSDVTWEENSFDGNSSLPCNITASGLFNLCLRNRVLHPLQPVGADFDSAYDVAASPAEVEKARTEAKLNSRFLKSANRPNSTCISEKRSTYTLKRTNARRVRIKGMKRIPDSLNGSFSQVGVRNSLAVRQDVAA